MRAVFQVCPEYQKHSEEGVANCSKDGLEDTAFKPRPEKLLWLRGEERAFQVTQPRRSLVSPSLLTRKPEWALPVCAPDKLAMNLNAKQNSNGERQRGVPAQPFRELGSPSQIATKEAGSLAFKRRAGGDGGSL